MKKTRRNKLRVLAIGAHPDDVEICCAGTLARYIERGDHVTVAIVCKGDSASLNLPPDQLVQVRSREAQAAARVLGADLIQMGLPDWGVDPTFETTKLFAGVIRQAQPNVILTHFHTDYGSDHNNTFVLVRDGALAATVPNIKTGHRPLKRQPAILLWEPLGGYGFQPDAYVDITKTMRKKLRMLACHKSQREWLDRHGGIDFVDYVNVTARFRGYQAAVKMAEGFVTLKNWAQIPAGSLLP